MEVGGKSRRRALMVGLAVFAAWAVSFPVFMHSPEVYERSKTLGRGHALANPNRRPRKTPQREPKPVAIDVQKMARMLEGIRIYGFNDERILKAMSRVPRPAFVPADQQQYAYHDSPLPIGYGQTISQPYIVAEMTSQLQLNSDSRVLEVGTGSGYQAAVLAELTPHVFTMEIIEPLARRADQTLKHVGYDDVLVRRGDGYYGWKEHAPYDAIIVTCAAGQIPPPLVEQLKPGGRMVVPVGRQFGTQYLMLITKDEKGQISSRNLMAVRFVPLTRS